MTHAEECNVVVDEVVDDACLLRCLSPSLEQAGGEDGGQFVARHVVEVGALLNPESQGEVWLKKKQVYLQTGTDQHKLMPTHKQFREMLGLSPNSAKGQLSLLQTIYIINIMRINHKHPLQVSEETMCNVSISEWDIKLAGCLQMPPEVGELTGLRRGAADAGFCRVSTQQNKALLFHSTPVKRPVVYY